MLNEKNSTDLEIELEKAIKKGVKTFFFRGKQINVDYAKQVIQYLTLKNNAKENRRMGENS